MIIYDKLQSDSKLHESLQMNAQMTEYLNY